MSGWYTGGQGGMEVGWIGVEATSVGSSFGWENERFMYILSFGWIFIIEESKKPLDSSYF